VIGNISLGRRGLESGGAADVSLGHAHVAAMRTSALAEQMLAYAGRGSLRRESGDLHEIASETVDLARVSVPHGVLFKMCGTTDCTVMADLTQVRQLVMNLVTNAGEAIGDDAGGTISVHVSQEQVSKQDLNESLLDAVEPGEFAVLKVSDDGCGMDEETLNRLFEPFFTTKMTGRGLGMSAALGIVRAHRGALWVQSTRGRGTTFRIAIPTARRIKKKSPSSGTGLHSERVVLIAEDDDTVRKLTRITLQRAGFEVVEARDGREAVELFHANADRIGVALLDSLMPGLSGTEVMRNIRSARPGLPVVVCSGYIKEGDLAGRDLSPRENPTALLPKPWQPNELIRVIRCSLERE
ncbi:MAG: response regulator, partial [Nannocystaceae bacterium]|nr:response regulator [Nannocystaceae bacterium]